MAARACFPMIPSGCKDACVGAEPRRFVGYDCLRYLSCLECVRSLSTACSYSSTCFAVDIVDALDNFSKTSAQHLSMTSPCLLLLGYCALQVETSLWLFKSPALL